MLQQETKGSRANPRSNTSRMPNRGGIHKQKTGPRVDRDGDLVMSGAPATRGSRGRGRGGRSSRQGPNDPHIPKAPALDVRTGINTKIIQQAIAQSLGSHGPAKGPRSGFKSPRKGGFAHDTRGGLVEISVTGLQESMAAHNPGGGISDLTAWLEHKASRGASEGEMVKIKKVCLTPQATR